MRELLQPIKSESLVEVFIQRFEKLILSGKISIGQKLPSERELAFQLGISRPVVHEGLLDLETKGLVTMVPRVGTFVNDYRKEGSLELLNSLVHYHEGNLAPGLFESLLSMRAHFEIEFARLAALNRTEEHLTEIKTLLAEETAADPEHTEKITEFDFRFHHLIALASGNLVYPLLLNSFKEVYTNLTSQFFRDISVVSMVFSLHQKLYPALEQHNPKGAEKIMKEIISHGESHLRSLIVQRQN
ncbi:MAG TPA: FadR/GntR family transcriptional regulator [Spirochaetota bacterium]|nr:FadR/GntR family transcriptional regulator [Spirochaetota bacterium]HQP47204.1 FadR/GntR family transcriptional regulator [Spirochaetota bacterium]